MSAEKVWYIDSSAIVKLVAREPESAALRRFVRRRSPLVASALARTEVNRAGLALGDTYRRRAGDVLGRIDLVRVNNQVLSDAGRMEPVTLRSLDAIHLATAALFESTLSGVITYDGPIADAARSLGWKVSSPA
ncbi:MAG: type II toxin-antitoxin system VapC family toxin [Actinomycetota bacterium]|nr:type II toxin-antitoxin system VapC family toxin [Actinomycetota bacterium]